MKNILTYGFIVFGLIFLSNNGTAQIVYSEAVVERVEKSKKMKLPAKEGTFQLYTSLEKQEEFLTTEHLFYIEEQRDDLVEKIIYLGFNATVRILPYSVIDDPDFVPLTE